MSLRLLIQFIHAVPSYFRSVLIGEIWVFSESWNFFGTWVRQVFVMSSKKKVIYVINMQKFINSNIRHLKITNIITLFWTHGRAKTHNYCKVHWIKTREILARNWEWTVRILNILVHRLLPLIKWINISLAPTSFNKFESLLARWRGVPSVRASTHFGWKMIPATVGGW